MIKAQTYVLPFISKQKIAENTYTFSFKKPPGFTFLPGQYNRWTLPIKARDGKGSSRFFTISSAPSDKDILSFTTRIGESDFKDELLNLKKDSMIAIYGPMGIFTFEEENNTEKIFIAGGIGITPFFSYIKHTARTLPTVPITLFASYSYKNMMLFYDDLKKIERQNSNIQIIYTITQDAFNKELLKLEKGRITKAMIEKYVQEKNNKYFYIVGSPQMVEEMYTALLNMKVLPEKIRTEQFTGY